MRVLALDHGNARIGCAVSDPTGTLVRPLAVIEPPEASQAAAVAQELEAECIVVGMPRTLAGEEGTQAEVVKAFCAELERLTPVPVKTYDERLTTRMAQATRRSGATAAEDSIAAAHLLEGYLARFGD